MGPSSHPPKREQSRPIFGPFLWWTNGWMHRDTTWFAGRPQPRRLCVRWESSSPSPKRKWSPQFLALVYCGQTAGWIKMPLGTEVGLSPGDIVLDGDPASPQRKGTAPTQFFAHVYCGQTAVCIRIPLGTEVGISFGDIVLDGNPPLPPLKGHCPQFLANVRCGQMAAWIKMPLGM